MRLLVCGGRDFGPYSVVATALWSERQRITAIIAGGARGVDSHAATWAKVAGVPLEVFPADWSLGRKAGPLRNQRMIDEGHPDYVLAFPGGRGTADMVWRATRAGVPVQKVFWPVEPKHPPLCMCPSCMVDRGW